MAASLTGSNGHLRGLQTHKRNFSIDGRMMGDSDENIMCFWLRIVDHCCDGHSRNIKFPFDVRQDTPVSVMREMQAAAVELQISEQEVLSVSLMIMEKIWSLQSAVIADRSTTPTAKLQHQFQCHEVTVERPRISNRRIINNDSMTICSSTSRGSSASSSKRSQDQYSTSSKKVGSTLMMTCE